MNGRPILHLPAKRRPTDPGHECAVQALIMVTGAVIAQDRYNDTGNVAQTQPTVTGCRDLTEVLAPWTAAPGVALVDPCKRRPR